MGNQYQRRLTSGFVIRYAMPVCLLLAAGCSGQDVSRTKPTSATPADNGVPVQASVDNAASAMAGPTKNLFLVNGEPVTSDELRIFIATVDPEAMKDPGPEIPGLTDQLINNRLLAPEAVKAGLDKTDELRSRLESNLNRIWKDAYWVHGVLPTVKISEKEIMASVPPIEEMVSIQQLVVESKEKAEALRAKAVGGGDFDAIVKENTEGLSGRNAGKIGFIKANSPMYEPDLVKTIFKLKPGEYTPVVSTQIGYSVIEVLERKSAEQGRKEWLAANRKAISDKIRSQFWNKKLDKLIRSHKVVTNQKTVDAYHEARKNNKSVEPLLSRTVFSIDGHPYLLGDLVDPSGMGFVHGEGTLEVIVNKRAEEFAIAREVERLKIKQLAPEVAFKERFLREKFLGRAYVNYRCRDIRVSPAEIRKYYDENPSEFVKDTATGFSFIETRSKARVEKIYADLQAGMPFGEAADKWSDNKTLPGGKSVPVPESNISPEFAAVKALKVGEYLKKPIVLKAPKENVELFVIARKDEVVEKRRIPFEEAEKGDIEKALLARKRARVVNDILFELRKNNKVEFLPEYEAFRKTFVRMTNNQRGAK